MLLPVSAESLILVACEDNGGIGNSGTENGEGMCGEVGRLRVSRSRGERRSSYISWMYLRRSDRTAPNFGEVTYASLAIGESCEYNLEGDDGAENDF